MTDLIKSLPLLAKAGAASVLSAIALWLVWTMTMGVASAAQVTAIDVKLEQHLHNTEAQLRIQRIICASVAKTETTALECYR